MSECRLICGDAIEQLGTLPAGSARCCVTSPPYFGLRDYGADGQIGLEPTPEAFVARLVDVFRAVRRVLADDGTLWLNLGDSYATQSGKGDNIPQTKWKANSYPAGAPHRKHRPGAVPGSGGQQAGARNRDGVSAPGLKPKDLIGIPWRVAFALQADGWYLRSDIIWHKPNPMPESVRDRPTKAHEYLFLLAKRESYFYDADAVREPHKTPAHLRTDRPETSRYKVGRDEDGEIVTVGGSGFTRHRHHSLGRNRRSVWTVATRPYKGAHFATFPPKLIEPCVLAGSARGDTVLDPFAGSGTTGAVAVAHGRNFVGIDLNAAYLDLARDRIGVSEAVA